MNYERAYFNLSKMNFSVLKKCQKVDKVKSYNNNEMYLLLTFIPTTGFDGCLLPSANEVVLGLPLILISVYLMIWGGFLILFLFSSLVFFLFLSFFFSIKFVQRFFFRFEFDCVWLINTKYLNGSFFSRSFAFSIVKPHLNRSIKNTQRNKVDSRQHERVQTNCYF